MPGAAHFRGTDHNVGGTTTLQVGHLRLEFGRRTYVMGILNVADGADILDVGGESTRPGARPVPLEEELRRVVLVTECLANECGTVVSDLAAAQATALINGALFLIWGWAKGYYTPRNALVPLIINIVLAGWIWSARPKS